MDALVGLGDDGLDAQERGALGRPVAGRAGAVLLAGQDDQRDAGGLVVLRGVVDEGDRAALLREVARVAALGARRDLVAQADVGERTADHDLVVAPARAVGVEVTTLHTVLGEVLAGRGVGLDGAGRGDVVGGDRVAQLGQDACAGDVLDRRGLHGHALEVRGLAHVGGLRVPLEGVAGRDRERLPLGVAREDVLVGLGEHVLADGGGHDLVDLGLGGPDVLEEDRVAVLVGAQGVLGDVHLHGAGQGVRDDQRRGRQVVHLDVRVDPALEVAVAGEHRGDREVVLVDRLGDLVRQRAGVADAGGAAVADQVEADLVEVGGQARLVEVVGDDLGARGEGGLDPRLAGQALLDRLLGHQRGGDHDVRVRGVGAGGDRGDGHGAVVQLVGRAVGGGDGDRLGRGGVREGRRGVGAGEGLDARLHLVRHVVADVRLELLGGVRQDDAVLRALRAGDRRDDGGQVQLELLGEVRLGGRVQPEALLLGVRLDQRDLLLAAAGQLEVVQRLVVDREDRGGGAELGRHVADGGAVGQRGGGDALAVELDELADDAVLAQHLGDGEHQVGGGGAGLQLAGQLEADDARDQHGDRLAEHGGLGLDAADAPAEDAEAVDHGGVRVGADQGVRVGLAAADHDRAGQVLDVHLVDDAGARRDDLELVERGLAPAQELVALAVAAVLQLDVLGERLVGAELVGDDRVVDDQLGRGQRVDLRRVAAELLHGLAHGGEVHDAGHAGEVLHDHAGRRELDLLRGLRLRVPAAERPDVVGGDVRAVLGAQQVLQQDLEAVRQAGRALHLVQPEDLVRLVAHLQRAAGVEAVRRHDSLLHLCARTTAPHGAATPVWRSAGARLS